MTTKPEYLNSISEDHRNGWITVGCIPAPGCRDKDGYGVVRIWTDGKSKGYPAHNYTLRQTAGSPPPDKPHAAHSCRMKGCCNPAHVRWASPQENNGEDKLKDGTVDPRHGERHHLSKLTDPEVLEIRRLYATGKYLQRELAEMYGVTRQLISHIILRKRWPHI